MSGVSEKRWQMLKPLMKLHHASMASNENSMEILPGQNSEQIERRTSNAQHRTLNIDDATLYRFYNKRTAEIRRVDSLPAFVATSAE